VPKKPNCYDCIHRGDVPGDAHSCCKNPASRETLKIKGHPLGIRGGWFLWPMNFDPTWLVNCDGFEAKPEAGK